MNGLQRNVIWITLTEKIRKSIRKLLTIGAYWPVLCRHYGLVIAVKNLLRYVSPVCRDTYRRNMSARLYQERTKRIIQRNGSLFALWKPSVNNGPIWVCWWQGYDEMPVIVRQCYSSVLRHAVGRQVVLIDQNNYQDYVTVPETLVKLLQTRHITITAFSDYLRFALLYRYGGLWIDSTVMLTEDLSNDIWEYPLYSCCSNGNEKHRLLYTSFFIAAQQGNPVCKIVTDFYDEYFQSSQKQFDFWMTDLILRSIIDHDMRVADWLQQIPANNGSPFILETLFNKACDSLCAVPQDEYVHKLTYKRHYLSTVNHGEPTVYSYVINGQLETILHEMYQ